MSVEFEENPFVYKASTKCLKYFKDDRLMELLFIVRDMQHVEGACISDYVRCMSSYPQSRERCLHFLRDMARMGVMVERKIDTKHRGLLLSVGLAEELSIFMTMVAGFPMNLTKRFDPETRGMPILARKALS